MEIDLGGIGKEYAADRVAALLRNASPDGVLVNLGGDIAVARQRADGSPWKVGIESVSTPGTDTMINLKAGALATSAGDTCTQAGMLSTFAVLKGAAAEEFLAGEGVRHWCRR